MTLETSAENRSFGGRQLVLKHRSEATGTEMAFSVYLPPQAEKGPCPAVFYLSGLTCTWENVTTKAGFQRDAADLGLVVVCPDTSPRGLDLPGEHDAYDFGSGAGFYVDATEAPWTANYRMYSYVTEELPGIVRSSFPVDMERVGVFGHSMGGHGALVTALRKPGLFRSVSAFAPICSPMRCPWGEKALSNYLGGDRDAWRAYDATALIEDGCRTKDILVDQGGADNFLEKELKPELLEAACARAGIPLTLRRQAGYDHSYYFIASFMPAHLRWHGERLRG
ncbi:MAG: S-formylglutathione hydrolase [Geminicoccaceae bacterium]|nr:S-formylglutathione hydrolase [Geminicoccaceae bacterium]